MADSSGGAHRLIIFAFLLLGCLFAIPIAKVEAIPLGTVIGIDLGRTYSSVAIQQMGHVKIIANEQGNRITPSWVAFTDSDRLIGEAAKNQTAVNPERTIFDVKRLIGRKFDDEEVQKAMKLVPYKIVSKEGKPYVEVKIKDGGETKLFSPEEISALVLYKMKETASAFLRREKKDAVITVPAYFNDAQRQVTKDAGVMAGLNVADIVDEPIAAAFAYGLHWKYAKRNVLVFNLGGSFDASILNIDIRSAEVLSTTVDSDLGGEAFDQRMTEYLIKLIKKKYGKDISSNSGAVAKLRREAERAKIALSSQHQVLIEIKSFFDDDNGVVHLSEPLSRTRFEELNNDLFRKTLVHLEKAMEDAGLENKTQIDDIVLVGGSSRIPKVRQLLRDYFDGKEPNTGVNPDEAVAYGAAIKGYIVMQQQPPFDLFIFDQEEKPRISQELIDLLLREVAQEKDEELKERMDAPRS